MRRGGITKTGNAHLRRILVEAARASRQRNVVGPTLSARRKGCPPEVIRIARKAQDRLRRKFWRMMSRNKPAQVAVVAVARELAGFVWTIAQHSLARQRPKAVNRCPESALVPDTRRLAPRCWAAVMVPRPPVFPPSTLEPEPASASDFAEP